MSFLARALSLTLKFSGLACWRCNSRCIQAACAYSARVQFSPFGPRIIVHNYMVIVAFFKVIIHQSFISFMFLRANSIYVLMRASMSHSVRYRNNHLTYFSLYSSRTGGPQPWIKEPRSHFHRLAVEGDDDSVVSLTSRLQHPGGYPTGENFAFQVTCAKLGTVDLILIVGNEKSLTLPKPGSCLSLTFFSTFTKIIFVLFFIFCI